MTRALYVGLLVLGAAGCGLLHERPLEPLDEPGGADSGGCAPTTWYADRDGDRWGDDTDVQQACGMPDGAWVAVGGDCNDSDDRMWPGGVELCDGVDNDCDDSVDEDDAADAAVWYIDGDSDGVGSDTVGGTACAVPSGGAAERGDCDDTEPAAAPGLVEVCDGVDNDCDGATDDLDPDLDLSTATVWYVDEDGDGHGVSDDTIAACSVPDGYAAGAADCDDSNDRVSPGAAEVCDDGVDNNCDGTRDGCGLAGDQSVSAATGTAASAEANARFGQSIATADFNGDGVADLLMGGEQADAGASSDAGAAFVVFGPITGAVSSEDGARFDGPEADGLVGQAVVATHDLTGDGLADFAVSATDGPGAEAQAGVVYLVEGPVTAGRMETLSAAMAWVGPTSGDRAGESLAAQLDLDADGHPDLLVGAYSGGSGPDFAGQVFLLRGPVTGGGSLADADHVWDGLDPTSSFGASVAAVGDVDGDGFDDFAVGAGRVDRPFSEAGAAFIFHGPLSTVPTPAAADEWLGVAADDHLGHALAGVGDVDGDGLDDVLVGAYGEDSGGDAAGALYLLTAACGAPGSIAGCPTMFTGPHASALAGLDPAAGRDVDGDGFSDLLIGVQDEDTTATSAGRAFFFYGPASGVQMLDGADARFLAIDSLDRVGEAVGLPDDLTGDGVPDLVVGARHGGSGGAVYVFAGGGF